GHLPDVAEFGLDEPVVRRPRGRTPLVGTDHLVPVFDKIAYDRLSDPPIPTGHQHPHANRFLSCPIVGTGNVLLPSCLPFQRSTRFASPATVSYPTKVDAPNRPMISPGLISSVEPIRATSKT